MVLHISLGQHAVRVILFVREEDNAMKNLGKLLVLCLALMLLTTRAFASNNVRTGEATDTNPHGTSQTVDGQSYSSGGDDDGMRDLVGGIQDEFAPNVTTQDIIGKLETKGNDIVAILQTVGKYVCIAAFIICCGLTLIGIIGNKRILTGAIIGLFLSGIAYAGIVCGREIVNWIAAWARS